MKKIMQLGSLYVWALYLNFLTHFQGCVSANHFGTVMAQTLTTKCSVLCFPQLVLCSCAIATQMLVLSTYTSKNTHLNIAVSFCIETNSIYNFK